MKKHLKRGLSALLTLLMLLGVMSGLVINAAATGEVYNQGIRGTAATYLSPAALEFYDDNNIDYDDLLALSGSSTVNTVPSSPLYTALQKLMRDNHSHITSYDETKNLFRYTDCQDGGGSISSFYSGRSIGPAWDGSSWNREHVWPNSKGLNGNDENDIMMLRPTAQVENSTRGNKAYGESFGYYHPNSESDGTYDLRGDVARIVLYVYVRWGNTAYMWGTGGVMESKDVLLQWMEEDPVDTWELGRNDSVESITGTRNVFVDYPELSFLLFNEEIPSDMITPSGEAADDTYSITASVNNSSYGSVSVSGRVINAFPANGYQATGYEVLSGTATVSQRGNTFVVSPSSDCTVQINFAPLPYVGICFWENGTFASGEIVRKGDSITLPDPTATPDNYTFVGWSDSQIDQTNVYPTTLMAAGSNYTVSDHTGLYAIYSFSEMGGGESYVLVTDPEQLAVDAQVVIAAANANFALSTTQNNNNRGQAAITKNSNDTISWTANSNVAVLDLRAGSIDGTYAFYCTENNGYLYCASTSSNHLRTRSTLDAQASFSITVNTDGTCKLVSKHPSSTRNVLQYNSQSSIFSCYANTMKSVSLYVKTTGGIATYYTTGTSPACAHDEAAFVPAAPATCTTSAWSEGLYCNTCRTYVFGREMIGEPLGHQYTELVVPPTAQEPGYTLHTCTVCQDSFKDQFTDSPAYVLGDANNDQQLDSDDAIYLLKYTLFPDAYPIEQTCDFDASGTVTSDDAIYLLKHTLFPDLYPLHDASAN